MKMFRKDEGFTLVELMVVVLIIGILVAIAVPIFNAAKGSAQQKSCWSNERTIEGSYNTYLGGSDTGGQPNPPLGSYAAIITALTANADFLKAEPLCPANSGASYTINAGTLSPQDSNSNYLAIQLNCSYSALTTHATHP